MRDGGFSDLLNWALALGMIWALSGTGPLRDEMRRQAGLVQAATDAARTRAMLPALFQTNEGRVVYEVASESLDMLACAAPTCPVVAVLKRGQQAMLVRSLGYRWFGAEMVDDEGRIRAGFVRTP